MDSNSLGFMFMACLPLLFIWLHFEARERKRKGDDERLSREISMIKKHNKELLRQLKGKS